MNDLIIKIVESEKELRDAMEVRKKVFQEEQGIKQEDDFDGEDNKTDHTIAYLENIPIATARIKYLNEEKTIAKIQRVAVLKEKRRLGLGLKVMEHIHNYLDEKGVKESKLESQEHAKGFYEKLGYEQKGEAFEEVGIPHVKMEKKFNLRMK
jgi:predicted GNAT family N-acyltransferase